MIYYVYNLPPFFFISYVFISLFSIFSLYFLTLPLSFSFLFSFFKKFIISYFFIMLCVSSLHIWFLFSTLFVAFFILCFPIHIFLTARKVYLREITHSGMCVSLVSLKIISGGFIILQFRLISKFYQINKN